MSKAKRNQEELAILNVDDKLHRAVVKKFIGLITFDLVSFVVLAIISGYFTFHAGTNILPGVFFALTIGVIIWNIVSLIKIMMKKYICCLVRVDKVWEEKGVLKCRIAPDAYNNCELTGDITVKSHTKNLNNVKEGEEVIAVIGKFSRYIYLFDYAGDRCVTERKNITVTKNDSFVPSPEYAEKYRDNMVIINNSYLGKMEFEVYENAEGDNVYALVKGLENINFGPYKVWEIGEINILEERLTDTIKRLENAYRNSEHILTGLYERIFAELNTENSVIDVRYVEKNFLMEELIVSVVGECEDYNNEIVFYGRLSDENGEEIFVGRTFRIAISCDTSNVAYELDYF